MKIGFELVLFIVLLNVVSTVVYQVAVPGTEYAVIQQSGSQSNATQMESEFNATTMLGRWKSNFFESLPFVGILFSMVFMMWDVISVVVNGFPALIQSFGYLIGDPVARAAFDIIMTVFRLGFAAIIFFWIFEIATGRPVME